MSVLERKSKSILSAGILICILLELQPCMSQVLIPPYFTGVSSYTADSYLDMFLSCRKIVGINLAVVHWNESFSTGYGKTDLETNQTPTNQTIFKIASLTKAFTATLLTKLLHEHPRYTLDTTVREILGDDFYFYDTLRTEHVTIRDILAHRVGISNNNYVRLQDGFTREKLVQKLRFLEPSGEFRGSFLYSNLLYGLAAYIIDKLGGKSWEQLTHEHIFEPLGMTSSGFMHELDQSSPDLAKPYLPISEGGYKEVSMKLQKNWGTAGGSGSITSTASDMIKWLHMQLNQGKSPDGVQVVPEEVLAQTHTPVNVVPESSSEKAYRKPSSDASFTFGNYGLGWRTGFYRGRPIVTHTGTSFGYASKITLLPSEGIGIFTGITGSDSGYKGRRFLHMVLMDHLLGENKFLDATNVCTFPSVTTFPSYATTDQMSNHDGLHLPWSSYTGTFGNFAYGEITVQVNKTHQQLEIIYGPLARWLLVPTETRHLFIGKAYGEFWQSKIKEVRFIGDEGNPDNIESVQLSIDSKKPPIFQRNLRMSDPPPPPDVTCMNSAHSLVGLSATIWSVVLAVGARMC